MDEKYDAVLNRQLRYHDNIYHPSNWCKICCLYYCWHEECTGHWNDERAIGHKFIPDEEEPQP